MESIIYRLFVHNWQRKLLAGISALVIWFFVNHSIIETKTIPGVPIRIVNLPADKTILGLLSNGILSKRMTLTLTGSKDVVQELEPGDLEVLIDATAIDHDDWIVQISKKNLVSLNPSLDLVHNITQVVSSDHVIRLRKIITEQVPVTILPPKGQPPVGYEFLDIWPQQLTQTLTLAEEEIQALKEEGLELQFDLNEISKADLDAIKSSHLNFQNDEISFAVPEKWKRIKLSVRNNTTEELNDPEAQNLRIDFLRQELLPIKNEIPIGIFYPLKNSTVVNPENLRLGIEEPVKSKNEIPVFTTPLFARNVSRLFLDTIRENIQMMIIAAPKTERNFLLWSIQIIDPKGLEDNYIAFLTKNNANTTMTKTREEMLRSRFRDYLQAITFFTSPDRRLHIESTIEGSSIKVKSEK